MRNVKKGVGLEEFKRKVDQFAKKTIEQKVKYVQIELFKIVYERLVYYTPVLTSAARGNWYPSLNVAVREYDITDIAGVSETNASLTANEKNRMNDIEKQLKSMPLGQVAWVSNSLPYIKYLEDGTSQKAPAGMIGLATMDGLNYLESKNLAKRG